MNQNLSLYQIFYVTARHGNISHAAKELFISQPAISKSIRKLEETLQVPLFTRSSRGVTLTEDGKLLYEQVQEAFRSIDLAEETLRHRHALGISQLRIGVSTTLCRYILLPYLQRFIQEYPHVKVTIHCQSSYQTIELLENRQIDLGLIGRPAGKLACHYQPLQSIQDTFVCTHTYLENLQIREGSKNLTETLKANATSMLPDDANITRQHIDAALKNGGIELNSFLEVSTMDMLIEFAKIGLGIACVIREAVQKELDTGLLTEITLGPRIPTREIGFICRRTEQEIPAIQAFLHMFPVLARTP